MVCSLFSHDRFIPLLYMSTTTMTTNSIAAICFRCCLDELEPTMIDKQSEERNNKSDNNQPTNSADKTQFQTYEKKICEITGFHKR